MCYFSVKLKERGVLFVKKLQKNANLDEIIAKINEIVEKFNKPDVLDFDASTIPSEVRTYFDTTGGMVK